MDPIAHVKPNGPGEWDLPHSLVDHSKAVASRAAARARLFNGEVVSLAGLWHDLGKYQVAWQTYIRRETGFEADRVAQFPCEHPNHSAAGAMLAIQRFGPVGRVLAYLIAGHHAGLYDWQSGEAGEGRDLAYRLQQPDAHKELADSLAAGIPDEILQPNATPPDLRNIPGGKQGFTLWIRMLFSCLVDADFLDTEAYMSPDKAQTRSPYPSLTELKQRFNAHMAELKAGAKATEVNKVRASILDQCRAKAKNSSNLYTLTVPTGGGKTLASMAFALDHAIAHGKDRIIYVIPYTSIIEQTAKVYRTAFGDLADAVIEHHSSAEYEDKVEGQDKNEFSSAKLATENWDAPIIVTTNVQFFESLFAAKTSRCRKLHNVANSVVVIDEAQMMHPSFWQPMVSIMDLLRKHYGTTLVMSTATQPCFESMHFADPRKNRKGLDGAVELMDAPTELNSQLKRVEVHLPTEFDTRRTWEQIAAEIAAHPTVLAIVNTRKDARELFSLMPEGTIHLSALMCGEHRSRVIAEIKQRLKNDQPTRVISTQLVEAGVDFDFPVVYRAMAGLDSIAQAAGRCNREGLLTMGHTHVFMPPNPSPPGMLRKGEDACRSILHGYTGDPLDIGLFKQYFNHLYYNNDLDQHDICSHLHLDGSLDGNSLAVNFRTAAELFKLIDNEDYVPVVVRYRKDEEDNTVERGLAVLGKGKPERWVMRSLQRYIVNVRRKDALRMLGQRTLNEVLPGLFAQVADGLYHQELGLQTDEVKLTPDQYLA